LSVLLSGSRVLLTGASGGIGNAIARALHGRGAHLTISGRRADALEELRSALGDERVEMLPADLANRDEVLPLVERAGRVDVLVANAGLPASGPLSDFTSEHLDRAIDVNLRGPVQLAHALAPAMVERGSGHLVFISSIAGKVATPGSALYSATKFGLRGFGLGLREDLHGTGVGVTTVFPGFIHGAGMWAETGLDTPRGVATRSPEQVAEAVVAGIERNKAEIDVAPLTFRAGARLSGLAPSVVAALNRKLGARREAYKLGEAQRHKR
jgi:short-subunit dehydrogenase